jgi:hypothetical protein
VLNKFHGRFAVIFTDRKNITTHTRINADNPDIIGPVGSKLKAVVSSFLKWLQLKAPPFMARDCEGGLNTKCPLGMRCWGALTP